MAPAGGCFLRGRGVCGDKGVVQPGDKRGGRRPHTRGRAAGRSLLVQPSAATILVPSRGGPYTCGQPPAVTRVFLCCALFKASLPPPLLVLQRARKDRDNPLLPSRLASAFTLAPSR